MNVKDLSHSHTITLLDFPFSKFGEVLQSFCTWSSAGFAQQPGSEVIYGSRSPCPAVNSSSLCCFAQEFSSSLPFNDPGTQGDTCSRAQPLFLDVIQMRGNLGLRAAPQKSAFVLTSVRRRQQSGEQEPQCALNYLQLQQLSASPEPFSVSCFFVTAPLLLHLRAASRKYIYCSNFICWGEE